jgi:hypothetical protein
MGTHIQDFATFSSKLKEMKSIKEEQEKSAKQEEYAQFFKKTLQKYGVSSPGELKGEEEKKAFFNEIEKGWEPGKGLTDTGKEVMNESHFSVGDTVKCKASGMTGKVISLDKDHGAEDEKYYNVETEDGKIVKYAPNELVKESFKVDKKSNPNYKWEFEVKSYNDNKVYKALNNGGFKKLSDAGIEFGTDPQGMLVMGDTEAEKQKAIEILNSLGIHENFQIEESEINSDEEFREYAETVLKNQHGEDYDQTKADEVINGLLSKKEGDDYGALIGMLNKG